MRKIYKGICLVIMLIGLAGCANSQANQHVEETVDTSTNPVEELKKYTVIDSTGDESYEVVNLPVLEKKELFIEITRIDMEALLAANEKHPYFYLLPGDSRFDKVKNSNQQMQDSIKSQKYLELSNKKQLTIEQLTNIRIEGKENEWQEFVK